MKLQLFLESRAHQLKNSRRYLDAAVEFLHLTLQPFHGHGRYAASGALGESAVTDEVVVLQTLVVSWSLQDGA